MDSSDFSLEEETTVMFFEIYSSHSELIKSEDGFKISKQKPYTIKAYKSCGGEYLFRINNIKNINQVNNLILQSLKSSKITHLDEIYSLNDEGLIGLIEAKYHPRPTLNLIQKFHTKHCLSYRKLNLVFKGLDKIKHYNNF